MILLGLSVAGENERAAVRRGEVNVQHLNGGELLKHGAGRQPRRQRTQALLQRHLEAVSKEGYEDVRLDTLVCLVIDGPDGKIALEFLERLLHFGELDVERPKFFWSFTDKIGAQQIPAFVTPAGAQALAVQREGEGFRGDGLSGFGQLDGDKAFGAAGFFLRSSDAVDRATGPA